MTRRRRPAMLVGQLRENKAPPVRELRPTDAQQVCYRTKRDAARAFIGANLELIQQWGGLDLESSGGEFDSVNERYGLKGKRRATTLADAIWHALPSKRPFCLDRVDLDALNETAPARELGAFRLPDVVAVAELERQQRPKPRGPARGPGAESGPGYPLTGHECATEDLKGRRTRMPCASAPPEAEPTGRVLYRPRLPDGRRPRIYLDEDSDAVATEDQARELRAADRAASDGERTSFDFGAHVENPGLLTVFPKRSTLSDMRRKRDRSGRFVKRAKNPRRRTRRAGARRARSNPMPETALLINPSRRRRRSRRRRARRNPAPRRRLSRALSGLRRPRRRRARRNPGFFSKGGSFTIGHAGGAGAYGLAKNGIRRLYWMGKDGPEKAAERAEAVAKFNKHSVFVKAGIVGAGFLVKHFGKGKWSDVGEGIILAGLADGIESLTENIGLTPEERSEKDARQRLQGAGMLVTGGGLASVLVERERQLRAADDDELDELSPSDVFDDGGDLTSDDFEADEDELY